METASPNMALVCVPSTSVTSSQNMLPTSAEVPLNTLSTILPSDIFPEEITSPRLLKISPVPKKPENIQLRKEGLSFFITEEANIIEEKRNKQRGNKVKEQRDRKINSSSTSGLQGQKMQKKKSIKTDIHYQETAEDSETRGCEWWENYVQTTKEEDWLECVSCRKWLHEFCSPYKRQARRLRWKVPAREEQQREKTI